jgi:hypothetical protein
MFSPLKTTDPDWFEFPWLERLVKRWRPGEIVAIGALRRPAVPHGFMLKCTTAGQTGAREPAWAKTASATVNDGAAVWQMVPWAAPDLPVISSCSYVISPTGISNVGESIDAAALKTFVRLDAAAAIAGDYTVTATMIDSNGEQYVHTEDLEVP